MFDILMLRKRAIIEAIHYQLMTGLPYMPSHLRCLPLSIACRRAMQVRMSTMIAIILSIASKSYLIICADRAGTRIIRFPERCNAFNPFANYRIYENVTQFTRYLQEDEVLLTRYMIKQKKQ